MSTIQRESDRQSTAVVGSVRLCEGMVFDTSPLAGVLRDHRPLVIALVSTPEQEKLWNHLIRAYHYLSFRALVGERIKYLVFTTHGRLIAALGWGSSVWKLKSRDLAVGWTPSLRQRSLPLVANNSRFLILPWVRVPHLAAPAFFRPVAGLDVLWKKEHPDAYNVSAKAGLEMGKFALRDRHLRLLAEFYDGYSPYGQFFDVKFRYWGLGIYVGY